MKLYLRSCLIIGLVQIGATSADADFRYELSLQSNCDNLSKTSCKTPSIPAPLALKIESCKESMKAARCDSYFAQHPDEAKFRRECTPQAVCEDSSFAGTSFFDGCAAGRAHYGDEFIQSIIRTLHEIFDNRKKLDDWLDANSYSREAKREIIRGLGKWQNKDGSELTDAELDQTDIHVLWEAYAQVSTSREEARAWKTLRQPSDDTQSIEIRPLLPWQQLLKVLWAAAIDKVNTGVQISNCFKETARAEMACHFIAAMMNPGKASKLVEDASALSKMAKSANAAKVLTKGDSLLSASLVRLFYKRAKEGISVFENKELYETLGRDLDKTESVIRSWSGSGEIQPIIAHVEQAVGKPYVVLLADPGILSRSNQFIEFAKAYLQSHPNISPFELRTAFSKELGSETLYRGLVLTEDEAKQMQAIGMLARGMGDSANAQRSIASAFDSTSGVGNPFRQIDERNPGTVGSKLSNENNTYMSLSAYPEVSESVGYHASGVNDTTGKSFYLFQVQVSRISVIESHPDNIFSNMGLGQSLRQDTMLTIGDKKFATTRDPGVEVYVPYSIPGGNNITYRRVQEIPPRFHRGPAQTGDLEEIAARLRNGKDVNEKIQYVEGHFTEDQNFRPTVEKWLKDPATPFELRYQIMNYYLSACRYGNQIDVFEVRQLRETLNNLAPADRQAILERWHWQRNSPNKPIIDQISNP